MRARERIFRSVSVSSACSSIRYRWIVPRGPMAASASGRNCNAEWGRSRITRSTAPSSRSTVRASPSRISTRSARFAATFVRSNSTATGFASDAWTCRGLRRFAIKIAYGPTPANGSANFPFPHEVCDPPSLGGEPRAEVRRREVDPVSQPVLHVDRRGPSLSGDDPNLADASLPLDPAVLRGDPDLRVPSEDGAPDRLPMRPKTLRDFDDRDIADDVERTRQGSSEGGRHVGHVLVAPDRHEFLGELSLVDREAEVHAPRRGQQEEIAFPYDAEMLQEEAALEELLPGRLALPLRDCDAPGPHDAAMPRPAVKRFRVSRKRS